MVLFFRFSHRKCPTQDKGGAMLVCESYLILTLGLGTSSARNENLSPLLNRNIPLPLISGKYGLRNFWNFGIFWSSFQFDGSSGPTCLRIFVFWHFYLSVFLFSCFSYVLGNLISYYFFVFSSFCLVVFLSFCIFVFLSFRLSVFLSSLRSS